MASEFEQFYLPDSPPAGIGIVTVGNDSVLQTGSLKSPNFVQGREGWSLDSSGKVIAKEVDAEGILKTFVRGQFTAGETFSLSARSLYAETSAAYRKTWASQTDASSVLGSFNRLTTSSTQHHRIGQSFKVSFNQYIKKITVNPSRIGTVTDSLFLELYEADANGAPSGSILASKSVNASGLGLPVGSAGAAAFEFTNEILLTGGKSYVYIIYANMAKSDSNYFEYWGTSSGGYADGTGIVSSNDGSTWSTDGTKDHSFSAQMQTVAGRLYMARVQTGEYENFLGFNEFPVQTGDKINVLTHGTLEMLTGLTKNTFYYLNGTSYGVIATGVTSRKAGIAYDTDKLLMIPFS